MRAWFWQPWLAGAVLVLVGIPYILTLYWYMDGSMAMIGLVVFVAFGSFVLITLVSLFGLPLRNVPALRRWWRSRPWVALILVAVGAIAIFLSRVLATFVVWEVEAGVYTRSYNPQPVLAIAGFVLLAFGLVHWWPRREVIPSGTLTAPPPPTPR